MQGAPGIDFDVHVLFGGIEEHALHIECEGGSLFHFGAVDEWQGKQFLFIVKGDGEVDEVGGQADAHRLVGVPSEFAVDGRAADGNGEIGPEVGQVKCGEVVRGGEHELRAEARGSHGEILRLLVAGADQVAEVPRHVLPVIFDVVRVERRNGIGPEVDGAPLRKVRRADVRLGVKDKTTMGRGKNEQAHGPKVRAVNFRPQ